MTAALHSIQIISAILVIALVLLQRSTGDMGGSSFGETSFFQTRRGSERFFFVLMIVAAAIFAFASLAVLFAGR